MVQKSDRFLPMRLWLGALGALTVLRLILCASLPLAPDEAYYFLWSQHLQPGYFDHPPMVAVLIRIGTDLFGNTPLGIRCLGPLLGALGSILLWDAGEKLFPHRQAGVIAAALLNATLMVGAGTIIMTPDTPLLFFWTAGVAALARLITSGNPRWWLAVGLAVGLAWLSKYTAVLFGASVFIWLITRPEGKRELASFWPWASLAIALLVFAPDVYWNALHGWASYLKQGSRATSFDIGRSLQFLLEFIATQAGLFTPIILALAGIGLWRLGHTPGAAAQLLIWLTAVPGVIVLEHVISGRVESNWPAIMYPGACLAAAALPMALLRRWLTPALGLGFGLTALVYAQALAAPFPVPAMADPTALQFAGWQGFAAQAAAGGPEFLTSDDYATASALAFYGPPGVKVAGFAYGWNPRWRYFALAPAGLKGQVGVLVTRRRDAYCPVQLGTVRRLRGGDVVATYRLCRFTAPSSGVLLSLP
jgi:4-amino-4-deoxy-L-arabinose transferase-like glycosyltransferase